MKNLLIYLCISVACACIWTTLLVLLGVSTGRALFALVLLTVLGFFSLCFMAGAAVASRPPYYLDIK